MSPKSSRRLGPDQGHRDAALGQSKASTGGSRVLRPRATASLSVAPITVSDLTAPSVVGLEPRHFRELLRVEDIPHAVVGRRVIARVEHVLSAIDRLAASGATEVPASEAVDDAEPSADEILARIGRVRGPR